jgi:hypothetical protein
LNGIWEEAETADLTGFYSNVDMDNGDTAREVFVGWKIEQEKPVTKFKLDEKGNLTRVTE